MSDKIFKQNLNDEQPQDGLFSMQLLFKEHCDLPSIESFKNAYEKHIGNVQSGTDNSESVHFFAQDYKNEFKEGELPVQLMVLPCRDSGANADEIAQSQMWDCPNAAEILSSCQHTVVAVDVLGQALPYKKRAELLVKYVMALMDVFVDCEAVYFTTSGKLLTRDFIVNDDTPIEDKFIKFAVNVRFFNIQDTSDCIVDSLGMSALFLPDLQYHYKAEGINPNMVVNHAYNVLSYCFHNDNPIDHGQTITGVNFTTGLFDSNLQWVCSEEMALIQPVRPVLDVNITNHAAGNR